MVVVKCGNIENLLSCYYYLKCTTELTLCVLLSRIFYFLPVFEYSRTKTYRQTTMGHTFFLDYCNDQGKKELNILHLKILRTY